MTRHLAEAPDAQLVEEYLKHHNQQAFGTLYQRYLKLVYGFVYSRVGEQAAAEAITSDTFLTLLDVIDKYQPDSAKFSTFACGIAFNKIRQHWQKLSREKQVELEEDWLIETEESEEVTANETKHQLNTHMQQILKQLSDEYREVLVLRFIKGLSLKDTAQILNITVNNVKVRQNRALTKAQHLAEEVLHANS